MSKTFKVIVVMLIILIGSVYLTLPIHSLLPMFKFEKVFNRLVMIFTIAAAAIFILLQQRKNKKANVGGNFWREIGFDFSAPWQKLFLYGFVSGALAVGFIVFIEVVYGPRYARSPIEVQDVIERFFKGMLSGVIVGIIEEFFFRGFIFAYLKKRLPIFLAIILASAFYSMTHFLDNGQVFIPKNPSIGDAFRLLVGYVEPFTDRWSEIFPQFLGLFIFGIVLCLSFLRSRSLFLSIGLHSGVVFAIKFQHSFARKPLEDVFYPYFGMSPDYDGSFEWGVLILLGLIVWFVVLPRFRQIKGY